MNTEIENQKEEIKNLNHYLKKLKNKKVMIHHQQEKQKKIFYYL